MKPLLLSAVFMISTLLVNAQYGPPDCGGPMPGLAFNYCYTSCIPCDGIDNGFIGMNTLNGDINAFPPGYCAPQLHSPSFHPFVAGSETIIFDFFVDQCWYGYGIQVGVYSASYDCLNWTNTYYCDPELWPGGHTIPVSGLTPGGIYYFVIDGNLGDICNYEIIVTYGSTLPPPISGTPVIQGPSSVCEGAPFTLYTIDGVSGTNLYKWELDGVVVGVEESYSLPSNIPMGSYQLCATPFSPCDDTSGITTCMMIAVDTLPVLVSEVDLCEEDFPYFPGDGFVFSAPGVYEYFTFENQCLQNKLLILNALPSDTTVIDTFICLGGAPYEIAGQIFTQTGFYEITLLSSQGCDSTINLYLTAQPPVFTNLGMITSNEWIMIGDSLITMPGPFEVIAETVLGCDSIILGALEIAALDTVLIDTVLCVGDSLFIDTIAYVADTIHYDSIFNGNTFDTLIQTNISFLPNTDTLLLDTICIGESYVLGDSVYTEAGAYEYVFVASNGCDSTVSLQLAVLQPFDTVTVDICEGEIYAFGGNNLSIAGTYVDTVQGPTGCQSIVQLELGVLLTFETPLSEAICEGDTLMIGNMVLYDEGTYSDTLTAENGCDSILLIDLTVNPSSVTMLNASICEGGNFIIDGQEYTQAGDYSLSYTATNGCDSTVILQLTVLPESQDTIQLSICDGDTLSLNGSIYTDEGVYEQILAGSNGCDSTLTILLEVFPLDTTILDIEVCEGECYFFGSTPYCQSGVYEQVLTSVNGCDSLVILELEVLPVDYVVLDTAICAGDAYISGAIYIDAPGAYNFVLIGQDGCDSIVDIIITFLPDSFTDLQIEICEGDAYTVGDSTYTESGQYIIPFEDGNVFGCDSTVFLTLEVTPALVTPLDTTLCFGATLNIGPYSFINEVEDELLEFVDSNNCLTYIQLNLDYYEEIVVESVVIIADEEGIIPTGQITIHLAGGTPPYQYLWSNGRVSNDIDFLEAGDYFVIVSDAAGCQEAFYFTVPYDPGLLPDVMSEHPDEIEMLVYPNPFDRHIEIQLPSRFEGEVLELQIIDFAGKVQYQSIGTSAKWILNPDLPAGIYWLAIARDGVQIGAERIVRVN